MTRWLYTAIIALAAGLGLSLWASAPRGPAAPAVSSSAADLGSSEFSSLCMVPGSLDVVLVGQGTTSSAAARVIERPRAAGPPLRPGRALRVAASRNSATPASRRPRVAFAGMAGP